MYAEKKSFEEGEKKSVAKKRKSNTHTIMFSFSLHILGKIIKTHKSVTSFNSIYEARLWQTDKLISCKIFLIIDI